MDELTAGNLKAALWDILNKVRKGEIQPDLADAVASQAREILRTVKVQMQVAQQSRRPIPEEVVTFSEN